MRKPFAKVMVAGLAVLALSSMVVAQETPAQPQMQQGRGAGRGAGGRGGGRGAQPGFVASGVPAMPDPVGPAPKHDFNTIAPSSDADADVTVELSPYPAAEFDAVVVCCTLLVAEPDPAVVGA